MYKKIPAVIKYTGSKRNYINEILPYIPKVIDTFHEPFCGSASISLSMMLNDFNVRKYILSDINEDILNLLTMIRDKPYFLADEYKIIWNDFNKKGDDIDHRKNFFYYVRKNFNFSKSPELFFFLQRTSVNGMIRYNMKGEYNSPCQFSRPGMNPEKVKKQILLISELLNENNVFIENKSFKEFQNTDNIMFVDPPYLNTKGLYLNNFNEQELFNWLDNSNQFILTYDKSIHESFKYDRYIEMEQKISPFRNQLTKDKGKGLMVSEGLYVKG